MTTTTVLEEVGMDPTAVQELETCSGGRLIGGCTREPASPSTGTAASPSICGVGWPTMPAALRSRPTRCSSFTLPPSRWRRPACTSSGKRGQLAWDDTVAQYWPEFAKHGKDAVSIRHVLTHRGGFPETPRNCPGTVWQDWDYVVECMEDIIPDYPAGQIMAYHPRNFGWVIGELVRRIDGRHIGVFLRRRFWTRWVCTTGTWDCRRSSSLAFPASTPWKTATARA